MGIQGLFEVIGDGKITTIADYATRHFEKEGRPLRIAVDEAGWRFANLTPDQVATIREKEAAANPIEKTILWRILRLMKLNVQLIFVFDGPGRPWKRGRHGGGSKPDYERTRLLEQLLDHLKIPRHMAPSEAEAECAKMQQMGIVDAVWSDDSDTMMFGGTCQIEAHKVKGKRLEGVVRVYRAEDILAKHDFDDQSLVMFAMIAGGDYNVKGLPGCGPKTAARLCRREDGLARELCAADKRDLQAWNAHFEDALRKINKWEPLPAGFPELKALNHYRNPKVSTPEQLQNLRGLRRGWDAQIDQVKLRVLLRQRFNMWTKGFLKHFGPVFVVKDLARCRSNEARVNNMRFDIQLKRVIKKKTEDGEDQHAKSETKITFYPLPAVEIDLSREPEEEDWSLLGTKVVPRFDPAARVEAEILTCFLKHGLPEGSLEEAQSAPRRKKVTAADPAEGSFEGSQPTRRRKKATAPDPASSLQSTTAAVSATAPSNTPVSQHDLDSTQSTSASKKRRRPKKDKAQEALDTMPVKRKKSKIKVADEAVVTPAATFRHARTVVFKSSNTSGFEAIGSDDDLPEMVTAQPSALSIEGSQPYSTGSQIPRSTAAVIDLAGDDSEDDLPMEPIERPRSPANENTQRRSMSTQPPRKTDDEPQTISSSKPTASLLDNNTQAVGSIPPPTRTANPFLEYSSSDDDPFPINTTRPTVPPPKTTESRPDSLHQPTTAEATGLLADDLDDELPYLGMDQAASRPSEKGDFAANPEASTTATALTPGETISPTTLRALRIAAFAAPTSNEQTVSTAAVAPPTRAPRSKPVPHEVIDLT